MMRRLASFAAFAVMLAAGWLLRRWPAGTPRPKETGGLVSLVSSLLPVRLTMPALGWAALILATGAALIGAIVLLSGVVPVRASTGHWAITRAFLQFAKSRSVSTYSLGVNPPPLDDAALILRGAGHYEGGCRPCHGSVTGQLPTIPRAMTPRPPVLADRIPEWTPAELYSIVKHGVKFTGMPAWPAQQRDDEVWAVVAFLRVLPDLELDAYRRLSGADLTPGPVPPIAGLDESSPRPPATVLQNCVRCHGVDGLGRGGAFPKLAGQRVEYLENALTAYASGDRHSGIMQPIADALTADVRRELAAYYAALPDGLASPAAAGSQGSQQTAPPRTDLRTKGRAIAIGEVDSVPACLQCHGGSDVNPAYPILSNQHAGYLRGQLRLFMEGKRGGSRYAHVMRSVARHLSPEQAEAAAEYFASISFSRDVEGTR